MNAKLRALLTPWNLWVGFLGSILAAALVGGLMVFYHGLQITNLTDLVPWGLWITIDLSAIAVAGGAFFLCAVVYLGGLKEYQPVARTATFIGLGGYTMALLALILDIGRPDRFWHAMVYWNTHSLMWEVTMCICLYLTVLLLEVLPMLASFEWLRNRYPALAARLEKAHHFAPYLAVAGLCLSMLHQSSLGAIYGVLQSRPLWYHPGISAQFMMSAIAGGVALTIFASMLSARLTSRAIVKDELLERLSYFLGWLLVVFLYIRAWDVLAMTYTYEPGRTEGLALLTSGPLSFNFWFGEMLLGLVAPILLLLNKKTRSLPVARMLALALVVGGVVAYRWDTNLSGQLVLLSYLPGTPGIAYTMYTPALVEIVTGAGIVAYGLLLFSLGTRYLHVVDHSLGDHSHKTEAVPQAAQPQPAGAD